MSKIFITKFESRPWSSDRLITQAVLNEDRELPFETKAYREPSSRTSLSGGFECPGKFIP